MPNVEFRKVSEFKRGILVKLLREGYNFDLNYEKYCLERWIESDNFFFDNLQIADKYCFITCVDGEPIGFVAWEPRYMPEYAEIGDNCILPAYKGKGYGKQQLKEALRRICQNEVKRIIVTTDTGLIPAQHNYESVGFIENHRDNEHVYYAMELDANVTTI